MSKPLSLLPALLTAALFAFAAGNSGPVAKPVDADPIQCLDATIQLRFLSTRSFGMSRVLPYRSHGVIQFEPENSTERKVVSELKEQGYQVMFFLAGRHVLDTPAGFPNARYGLQGPALISNVTAVSSLPAREELLAESRSAMQTFAVRDTHSDGYDVRRGDWVMAMRPLRATNATCIQCHTTGGGTLIQGGHAPKLGDALGVAMYVYRRPQL